MKAQLANGLVVVVGSVMVLSMVLGFVPAALNAGAAHALAHPAPATPAGASVPAATAYHPTAFSQNPAAGHVRGTMNIYEVSPAGARTEDPAVAYDTVSYEPILNVYQTLINYNGSSTATYLPTLATCVPGTPQCVSDYGSNLTAFVNGTPAPVYWTFVIDPAAHFYDPTTHTSWPVEPSDVMFSIARTLGFADLPYAGKTAGWIISQSLLQYGNGAWDSSYHFPFNNTPSHILGSMLVNNTTYCPAAAMANANGCVTFIADGTGADWPYFLQLVADNLGGSIVPCGWFTAQSAGIPGWSGSNAANGDGPCMLPNGGNSTDGAGWATYLAGLNPTSWDTFEELAFNAPAVQTNVQWNMVGSGPYYAGVVPGSGYQLRANPGYLQPSGCSGVGGLATYTGYCDPTTTGYIHNVNVYWEPDDSFGISQYRAGSADFAGIETTHTTTLLQLAAAGDLQYTSTASISDFFTPIDLAWSPTEYTADFPSQPTQTIPTDFFLNIALREFYVHSYPYTTVENTVRTVDGIQYTFNAGGPIPFGMGNYYPANVSFATGDPDPHPADVGGAAWWWAQANNPSSAYFDPQLAACTPSTPCTWAIAGLQGDPGDDIAIADWISEIEALTHNALQPFGGASFDLTFVQDLNSVFASAYDNPLVSSAGTGWAPDYPDPTDYTVPLVNPDSTYTAADAFSQQLGVGNPAGWAANNTTCGHNVANISDLVYWAHAADSMNGALNSTCQGVAYWVVVGMLAQAASLPVSAQRTLDYNLVEHVTNALSMYIWNGQSNAVTSAAPWIDLGSANTNPMIGGGGDEIWFQIHYSHNVTFQESGLPSGSKWSVTLGATTLNSTTSSIVFPNIGNGSYTYSVAFFPGYGATPAGGTVPVSGDVTQHVTFAALSGAAQVVTFEQFGLVSNTSWSVLVTNVGSVSTNQPSLTFNLPNAAYTYAPGAVSGYTGSAPGGFTVAGSALVVNVTYSSNTLPVYNVTFTSSKLPIGHIWSVTLSSATQGKFTLSSTGSTISFEESAGNYSAIYGASAGYVATVPSAEVIVAGNTATVVSFSATFTVTFTETNLPAGVQWSVYFGGQTITAATTTITFAVSNGTWSYGIVAPTGYAPTPAGGTVHVTGAATGPTINFASTAQPGPSASYLSKLAYELIGGLAVLAAVGFGLAAYAAFRKPPAAPPPKGWQETGSGGPTAPSSPEDTEFDSDSGGKT